MIAFLKTLALGKYDRIGLNNKPSRDAWIKQAISDIPSGESILDAGAGECQYRYLCQHLRYTSQDFGKYDGKGDGRGQQTRSWDNSQLDIVSDIASIPVAAESFDNVLCTEVFEHVLDPVPVIKEFHRLLKPDGRLIITAPFCSFTHFAPFHFSTGFSEYWWREHLPRGGFRVEEITPNGNFFEYVGQELRHSVDVAQRLGGHSPSFVQRVAIRLCLGFLQTNSAVCANSAELAVHGFHVVAKKGSGQSRVAGNVSDFHSQGGNSCSEVG